MTEGDSPGPVHRLAALLESTLLVPLQWFERRSIAFQDRMVGVVLAVPGGAVLATAAYLTPDPSGMGTHQQLGLGGCAVLTLSGLPCPMCGMTTTFTHLAHFHLIDGTLNQPFGLLLFVATVVATVIGTLDIVKPAQRWRAALKWVEHKETAIAATLIVGMIGGWLYKVALIKGLFPWSP